MEKWYKQNQGLVWLTTVVVGIMAYAYTTFASIDYVDKKHDSVMFVLEQIRDDIKDTREKVYELNRRN